LPPLGFWPCNRAGITRVSFADQQVARPAAGAQVGETQVHERPAVPIKVQQTAVAAPGGGMRAISSSGSSYWKSLRSMGRAC